MQITRRSPRTRQYAFGVARPEIDHPLSAGSVRVVNLGTGPEVSWCEASGVSGGRLGWEVLPEWWWLWEGEKRWSGRRHLQCILCVAFGV